MGNVETREPMSVTDAYRKPEHDHLIDAVRNVTDQSNKVKYDRYTELKPSDDKKHVEKPRSWFV